MIAGPRARDKQRAAGGANRRTAVNPSYAARMRPVDDDRQLLIARRTRRGAELDDPRTAGRPAMPSARDHSHIGRRPDDSRRANVVQIRRRRRRWTDVAQRNDRGETGWTLEAELAEAVLKGERAEWALESKLT